MIFSTHSSGLTLRNSLGAFFHEKDFHCGEDDFDIFDQAGSGYIHEIHQEFVIGGGVVLAIDLGIAGESALGLEAEVPLREFFFVLGGNLGAFGAEPTMDMSPFRISSCSLWNTF